MGIKFDRDLKFFKYYAGIYKLGNDYTESLIPGNYYIGKYVEEHKTRTIFLGNLKIGKIIHRKYCNLLFSTYKPIFKEKEVFTCCQELQRPCIITFCAIFY